MFVYIFADILRYWMCTKGYFRVGKWHIDGTTTNPTLSGYSLHSAQTGSYFHNNELKLHNFLLVHRCGI